MLEDRDSTYREYSFKSTVILLCKYFRILKPKGCWKIGFFKRYCCLDIEVGEIPKYGSYIRCRCSIAICEDVKAMFKIADDLVL